MPFWTIVLKPGVLQEPSMSTEFERSVALDLCRQAWFTAQELDYTLTYIFKY